MDPFLLLIHVSRDRPPYLTGLSGERSIMLAPNALVKMSPDVFFQELDGESVLLNVKTGVYYGLDEVGTRMWSLLAEHGEVKKVCAILFDEYEVTQARLRGDLWELIEQLKGKSLVEVYGEETKEALSAVC